MATLIATEHLAWSKDYRGGIADIIEDGLPFPVACASETWYVTRYSVPPERVEEAKTALREHGEDQEEVEAFIAYMDKRAWDATFLVDCG
jgi:hypothetical protein